MAVFWCGAAMVGARGLAARIVANVFVWAILGFGLFFLGAFRDWCVGLELSVLSAGWSPFLSGDSRGSFGL